MNSLVRLLVVILAVRGGRCSTSIVTDLLSTVTAEVSSAIESVVNATSNLSFSNVIDLLNVTEDGEVSLNGLIETLNLTVNLTTMFSPLNVTVSEDGVVNLTSLISNLNITTDISMTDVLNLLGVETIGDVSDFKTFIQDILSVNLTDIVNSLNKTEDKGLDFAGLAQNLSLTVNAYNVTTEDGYILQMFHIPGNGSSVIYSHGIFDTADGGLLRGNTSSLYMLAQEGFDIWAINYRGNRYSRSHETLNPDTDQAYWEFSMHEKGLYDLAAIIDFILEKTGRYQLSIVGHSEGTAAVFILTSTKPEYNSKIKQFIALSPVCYVLDSGFAVKALIQLWPILQALLLTSGNTEWLGYYSSTTDLVKLLCSQGTVGYELCYNVALSSIFGYNPDNLKQPFFPTFLEHWPAGASSKDVAHYVQVGKSGVFGPYVSGSETATSYNLTNVTCDVYIVASKNDKILGLKSAERMRAELPNVVDYHLIENEEFTHADYVYGENAYENIYQYVVDTLT